MTDSMTAPTVLVVDDETSIQQALSKVLRKEGLQVRTAKNGKQALDVLRHHYAQLGHGQRRRGVPRKLGNGFALLLDLDNSEGIGPVLAHQVGVPPRPLELDENNGVAHTFAFSPCET